MTTRLIVYPYKPTSKSAKRLAQALGAKLIYYGHKFKPTMDDITINWGNTKYPDWWIAGYKINHPYDVVKAANKLTTFNILKEANVSIPEYTSDVGVATSWISSGSAVVVRQLLCGSGGMGISLFSEGDLPDAKLYVKYVPKRKEFRVHVFKGEVIDVQEKRRRNGAKECADYHPRVRSHLRGWVFCRGGIVEPDGLRETAVAAVNALGLDFGGVDIIWNEKQNKCYVLEVNTAPGIEGSTVEAYSKAIKNAF